MGGFFFLHTIEPKPTLHPSPFTNPSPFTLPLSFISIHLKKKEKKEEIGGLYLPSRNPFKTEESHHLVNLSLW